MDQETHALGDEPGIVQDIRTLRFKLKNASVGTGQVSRLLEASTFPLTERGFTMLIVSCRKSGQWRMAVEIFNTMTGRAFAERGIKPNFYTYSSLVSVCSAAGACSQAMRVFKEMRKQAGKNPELAPDAGVFSRVAKACHSRNRHKDVVYLYNILVHDCLTGVSNDTLVRMLESLVLMGRWGRVSGLIGLLEQKGCDVQIAAAYTRLLSTCATRGVYDVAVQIFLEMQMAGVFPDSMACHQMACVAIRCARPSECLDLIYSMMDAHVQVEESTLEMTLHMLVSYGFCDDARQLLFSVDEKNTWRFETSGFHSFVD